MTREPPTRTGPDIQTGISCRLPVAAVCAAFGPAQPRHRSDARSRAKSGPSVVGSAPESPTSCPTRVGSVHIGVTGTNRAAVDPAATDVGRRAAPAPPDRYGRCLGLLAGSPAGAGVAHQRRGGSRRTVAPRHVQTGPGR